MKSSEALRRVKGMFLAGEANYVCIGLEVLEATETDVYKRIVAIVGTRSIGSWLMGQPGVNINHFTSHALKDYRLRWIDWMIPAYERVGD